MSPATSSRKIWTTWRRPAIFPSPGFSSLVIFFPATLASATLWLRPVLNRLESSPRVAIKLGKHPSLVRSPGFSRLLGHYRLALGYAPCRRLQRPTTDY